MPWAFKGATCLAPDYTRCLVRLSRGGADAVETREFDLTTKTFPEGGFFLPESKGVAAWIGEDDLLVSTDFGEGSMTDSGYPRVVKRWRRGTSLADAETVFEHLAENADDSGLLGAAAGPLPEARWRCSAVVATAPAAAPHRAARRTLLSPMAAAESAP